MWVNEGHQVFVFGSNQAGRHGAGSALHALRHWGAVYGQGEGWQGQSYGIPTKDKQLKTLGVAEIYKAVRRFVKFAGEHPEMTFVVVEIGCGLAGYDPEGIAPMFHDCPGNCQLPSRFKAILDGRAIPSDSPERK